jgi:hypothetical protein
MGQTSASCAHQSRDYHGRWGGGSGDKADKGGKGGSHGGKAAHSAKPAGQSSSGGKPGSAALPDNFLSQNWGLVGDGGKGGKGGGGGGGSSAGAAHQKGVHAIGHSGPVRGGVSKNQTVREHTSAHLATDARHFPDRAGKSGYRK